MKQNISLASLTTFKIGGQADYFVEVEEIKDLLKAVNFAKENKLEILIMGGGSNMVISDEGFRGLVIKMNNQTIQFGVEKDGKVSVTAGAGVIWDELVKQCVERNLQGIECLSGIPGSVGASPVQNIGAYGQEIKDIFIKLRALDMDRLELVDFPKNDCQFDYRDSIFKKAESKGKYIIWEVELSLNTNTAPAISYQSLKNYLEKIEITDPTLKQVRDAVIKLRKERHIDPQVAGNAGSFFKNPIVDKNTYKTLLTKYPDIQAFEVNADQIKIFAGWLIEQAGWKGRELGNVAVSPKHALILINKTGKAKAAEVAQLAGNIQKDINKKFGVQLEREVNFINL